MARGKRWLHEEMNERKERVNGMGGQREEEGVGEEDERKGLVRGMGGRGVGEKVRES